MFFKSWKVCGKILNRNIHQSKIPETGCINQLTAARQRVQCGDSGCMPSLTLLVAQLANFEIYLRAKRVKQGTLANSGVPIKSPR